MCCKGFFGRLFGFKGLAGLFMMAVAAMAAIVALVVVVMAALAAIAAAAAALVAYLKRETWTLPAYRWARDRSGRWSATPWSSREGEPGADPAPDVQDAS
jgi:hypothetical protein